MADTATRPIRGQLVVTDTETPKSLADTLSPDEMADFEMLRQTFLTGEAVLLRCEFDGRAAAVVCAYEHRGGEAFLAPLSVLVTSEMFPRVVPPT